VQAHECSGCGVAHLSGFTLEFYAKKTCIYQIRQECNPHKQAGFMPYMLEVRALPLMLD
jgi:hypothetical protein